MLYCKFLRENKTHKHWIRRHQQIMSTKQMMKKDIKQDYWKENLKYLTVLLSIWFLVSFGFGILFVEQLNAIKFGGFKLGFWFAQQGAIYVFVILIFVYIRLMNKLDKKYDLDQ